MEHCIIFEQRYSKKEKCACGSRTSSPENKRLFSLCSVKFGDGKKDAKVEAHVMLVPTVPGGNVMNGVSFSVDGPF